MDNLGNHISRFCDEFLFENILRAGSLFFLVRRAKRARQKNDHARDRRGAKFRKTLKTAILYDIGIKVYCLVWRILKQ